MVCHGRAKLREAKTKDRYVGPSLPQTQGGDGEESPDDDGDSGRLALPVAWKSRPHDAWHATEVYLVAGTVL